MSRRTHLWLRVSAIAVIAAAAAIPRASGVADRPVAPALTASSGVVETGARRQATQGGASGMAASAMNFLPVAVTVESTLTDPLAVPSPVSAALEAPLRKDAKLPVARR